MTMHEITNGDGGSRNSLTTFLQDWRILTVLGVFLLMGFLALNDVLVYTPDSARYLVWAKSLSEWRGFEDLSIPEPFHYVVHAPLYSVLLAPVALVSPDNVPLAKLFTLFSGAALLILFSFWLGTLTKPKFALGAAVVLAIHPLVVLFSNQILSDVPFACTMVLVLITVERTASGKGSGLQNNLILAMSLSAGILLREVGITLLLGTVIFLLARGEYRRAVVVATFPVVLYAAWFVRNEIIVAGAEYPPLRNSEIFTLHYFTDRTAPFVSELFARFQVNLSVYADHIARLLFLPQYGSSPYGVIVMTEPPYSILVPFVPVLGVIFAAVSLGLAGYGGYKSVSRHPSVGFLLAFLPVYLLLIFFYPFNDVRFLLPLVVILVGLAALGTSAMRGKFGNNAPQSLRIAAGVCFTAALIPNLVWCFSYVRANMEYRQSPEEFYESVADQRPFPDMLTKPMGMVGDWITRHHPEPVVVMTQWKELTFWLPNGKLVDLNTLVPLDEFERFLRDYQVTYIVSAVGLAGVPEFFPQMVLSTAYEFQSEYRVANLEVFRVRPQVKSRTAEQRVDGNDSRPRWDQELKLRARFAEGLRLLEGGGVDSAKTLFRGLADFTRGGTTMILFLAIAHEFDGEYDQARNLLAGLQVMKQSGAFLGHATYHHEIIRLLEHAAGSANRAELLYVVSAKYWNLGFHRQSLAMLDSSLATDPQFVPSLIFGTYYNLELGRRGTAKGYYQRLSVVSPDHPLVDPLRRILAYGDSSLRRPLPEYALGRARAYEQAGLGDSAIRELLSVLASHPRNVVAMRMLAELYVSKRRYYPALKAAERWRWISPGDDEAEQLEQELLAKW